jgi:hypothetical protein
MLDAVLLSAAVVCVSHPAACLQDFGNTLMTWHSARQLWHQRVLALDGVDV